MSLPNDGTDVEKAIEVEARSFISKIRLRKAVPPFTHPCSNDKTSADALVTFDGPNDLYDPHNWSPRKKMATVIMLGLAASGATFNSAISASANTQLGEEFGVSNIVTTLTTTMILLGFATGPLLWGSLSEIVGRKYIILVPYFIASIFAFGCAASATMAGVLIMRFFQGFFSSSLLTSTGGVIADMYLPRDRGVALIIYSMSVVGGPLLAPIAGSAIATSYLGWRWIFYIVGIVQVSLVLLGILFIDETYAPVLLLRKARALRYETGNWALHAKHEEWNVSVKEMASKYLARPFRLMMNPICFLMSIYASFVYGLIYGSLEAIPIVFVEQRGYSPVVGSLPFIALLAGCVLGLVGNLFNQKHYIQAMAKNDGKPVPEARLYPQMIGSFLLSAGLFILAWTGPTDVLWLVPCIGIALVGAGFFPIYQAALNYIIDTFLPIAASAIATTTFMRSFTAAAFPIFIPPMMHNLGVAWGVSLLAFISVAMLPIPFLFFTFGKHIRALGALSRVEPS